MKFEGQIELRQQWIDVAKGLLILLVVIGHTVGTGSHLPGPGWVRVSFSYIYKVIYTFHMPAFFILAGVTWSMGKVGFLGYVRKKALRLLVPYYVFGLLFLILGMFVGSVGASADGRYGDSIDQSFAVWIRFFWGDACPLNRPLWFLPCLFVIELVYYPIGRFIASKRLRHVLPWALMALGYCVSKSAVTATPGWIKSLPLYLSFIMIGHLYIPRSGIILPRLRLSGRVPALLALVALYIFLGCRISWFWDTPARYFSHGLLAVLGAVLTFCISRELKSTWLAYMGLASIGIMVLHKLPISFLMLKTPLQSCISSAAWVYSANLLVIILSLGLSLLGVVFLRKWFSWTLGDGTMKLQNGGLRG